MVFADLAHQMGSFHVLLQERDILKGSFISIYISKIDSKMLLKINLFGAGKLSEHFAVLLFLYDSTNKTGF